MGIYTGDNGNNIFLGTNGESWTLNGQDGNDNLTGADRDDLITGGAGNDNLLGAAGNDYLYGNAGYDYLYGNGGDDKLIDEDGYVDGGAGIDTLVANYGAYGSPSLGVIVGSDSITNIYPGFLGLKFTNIEKFLIIGSQLLDTLRGGANSDSLYGEGGNDRIEGGAGLDYLYGGAGDDTVIDTDGSVDGGAGIDTLIANYSVLNNGAGVEMKPSAIVNRANNNPLLNYTNFEKFNVTGTQYADILRGGASSDILKGGAGKDQIEGGAGFDYLYGEAGDDTLIDTDGSVDGGADVDTLVANYADLNSGAGVHVGYLGQSAIFSRQTGLSLLNYTSIEQFNITGTQYADVLSGGAKGDTLKGGAGNDQIEGGAGYDYLYGEAGDDTIIDSDGLGYVDGGAGFDTLIADYTNLNNGAGVDVRENGIFSRLNNNPLLSYTGIEKLDITGTQYADTLRGGAGNDFLYGAAGNDSLNGGAGNDILKGGTGNDTLNGGSGYDVVNYEGNYTDYAISFLSNGDLQVIDKVTTNGNEGIDILSGVEFITAQDGNFAVLTGGTGNDVLTVVAPNYWAFLFGGDGADSLTGGTGYDNLTGGNGNDTLVGGNGNDTLVGGAGNDILNGGAGNDILTGGLGADKFVFNSKVEGLDIIKDFSMVEGDKIQISKAGFGGIADFKNFSYNDATGALLFQGTQFATIENKPANFAISTDIQLV
ncbi:MAG: calcium-binding protein [Nostoc sp. ChiSLP02]|nr:calcium-binding protein [Nostoc sp. DedSLP05]MDZ8101873.1 calcium-binding protein [Nostoc sp. DedSLP01]MDZ8186185.1 calcium-binding protein [Nostoc sp. ChiSLP02]